ncbi:unnamed protein product [Triticum turgidum subsp. durum]|uniref:Origin of replication complex subunit 4 n=2 Tax=Triticum turgidum subsp. durum TaxID=4567 RepID=A0A9R0RMB4_TRITD|nr:unnamed protein product [Triticum turgidum subsp. durum]
MAAAAPAAPVASQAQAVLRGRLCDPAFVHSRLRSSPDTNYSKLKYLVSSSVSEACNNSVLLLGPRGCGKGAVLDMVLEDLKEEHPDAISVIRLNGMLHSDDNCATKASSDDNTEFMIDMLRGSSGYSIAYLMQCNLLHHKLLSLDADQLLEKRVRSRFSHRKLLFVPSSLDDIQRIVKSEQNCIYGIIPLQSGVIYGYGIWTSVNGMLYECAFLHAEATQDGQFASISSCNNAIASHPCHQILMPDLSILELYILVCMNRLEDKEQKSYNFNTIIKEYKSIQDAYKTSDKYATTVCFRAFEHLLDRELITFADSKGRNVALEYRPVKLLISSRELAQSLKLNTTCPAVLQKLLDRERYM